jgi:undecaprenyl-diphosphatase
MLVCYWLLTVQIVVESFPISSSTHVKLLELFLISLQYPIESWCSNELLNHLAHGPTILILALFFYPRWSFLLYNIRRCWRLIIKLCMRVAVADLITCGFYIGIKQCVVPPSTIGVGMVVTAVALASLHWCPTKNAHAPWNWPRVLLLGCAQGVALLPGISRLALTFVTARWMGISPRKSFEISFLIQWPLIAAAFVHAVGTLYLHDALGQFLHTDILLIMLVSTIIAWYALRITNYCAMTGRLWWFAWYMTVPFTAWLFIR